MAHDTNALDCLFGPYDFLDTAQPPPMGATHQDVMRQQGGGDGYSSGGSGPRRTYRQSYVQPQSGQHDYMRGAPASRGRLARPGEVMEMMPLADVGGLPGLQPSQQAGSAPPPPIGSLAPVASQEPGGNKRPRLAAQASGDAELQDKADRCRARNREHARQTRRRKKEFVESLQVSVQQLDHENKIMAARLANLDERVRERHRRADAVASILSLRVADEDPPDVAKQWAELVESDFELKLPHTPYRSFPPYETTSNGRTVSGISAVMADVKSLRVCLGALKRRLARKDAAHDAARKHSEAAVVAAANEHDVPTDDPAQTSSSNASDSDVACETECVLERAGLAWATDGSLMAPWTLRVSDAKRQIILQQRGMLRATFRGRSSTARGEAATDDANAAARKFDRVAVLELALDTVAFWQQLQRGMRPDRIFKAVPNTLDQALQPSDEARVITSASRPFVIEYVNGPWTKLCGYDPDECVGKTLSMIQGPETSEDTLHKLTAEAAKGHATSALLTNYNKDGSKFDNYVRVFPLVDDDGSTKISHMLGVLQNVVG